MKRFITLSTEQKEELKALLKSEKNVKIHRRLQFIEMKFQGKKNTEIMPILKVSMETCRDWTGIFLQEGYSDNTPIHLFLDNARYQKYYTVQDYAKEKNIVLEYLPAYSPNLNLIERFWKFTKKVLVRN